MPARADYSPASRPAHARARRGEIGVVAEISEIADGIGIEALLAPAQALQIEAQAERELEEVEVDIVELAIEIRRRVGEEVELDFVALLLHVVGIVQGADVQRAPARLPDRLAVEGEVDAVERDALRAGSEIRVGLVADGVEDRGREGGRIGGERKLLDVEL